MPDVYATITEADPTVVEGLVDILELRAADAQQRRHARGVLRGHRISDRRARRRSRVRPRAGERELWPRARAWREVVGVGPVTRSSSRRPESLRRTSRILSFLEGDARALPLEDASFDVVVFHTTLCHVTQSPAGPETRPGAEASTGLLRAGAFLAGLRRTTTATTSHVRPATSIRSKHVPRHASTTITSTDAVGSIRRLPEARARSRGVRAQSSFGAIDYMEAPSSEGYMLDDRRSAAPTLW